MAAANFFADVFPARAGMIPRNSAPKGSLLRIPRESGDDPKANRHYEVVKEYSPRERG